MGDFTNNELNNLMNDIESEYFSFEFAPSLTKTQRNSVNSLMKIVAENIQMLFRAYRKEPLSFELSSIDSMEIENFLNNLSSEDSILFAFDFDGMQCEIAVSSKSYSAVSGIRQIEKKNMASVDMKLCFDFLVKPVLSELLKKFNSKSTVPLNFRTPKVIDRIDVLSPKKKGICIEFTIKISELKYPFFLVFPVDAFEKLVRLGVFAHPRRPLQNPFKYNATVVLDRIYLAPDENLEVGTILETTKHTNDSVEIIKDGEKIGEGELVAVREMFGVRPVVN